MANKNDLRFIKTERLLEETYIELKKKSSAPIKVNKLCEAALINKTTFYIHYETMDDLHMHICQKTVKRILNDCPLADAAFTDTEASVNALVSAMRENAEILDILFGNNTTLLVHMLEQELLKIYIKDENDSETAMTLSFAIGGATQLLVKSQDEKRVATTVKLLKKLL